MISNQELIQSNVGLKLHNWKNHKSFTEKPESRPRHLSKEEIQEANKHMKKCSTS